MNGLKKTTKTRAASRLTWFLWPRCETRRRRASCAPPTSRRKDSRTCWPAPGLPRGSPPAGSSRGRAGKGGQKWKDKFFSNCGANESQVSREKFVDVLVWTKGKRYPSRGFSSAISSKCFRAFTFITHESHVSREVWGFILTCCLNKEQKSKSIRLADFHQQFPQSAFTHLHLWLITLTHVYSD